MMAFLEAFPGARWGNLQSTLWASTSIHPYSLPTAFTVITKTTLLRSSRIFKNALFSLGLCSIHLWWQHWGSFHFGYNHHPGPLLIILRTLCLQLIFLPYTTWELPRPSIFLFSLFPFHILSLHNCIHFLNFNYLVHVDDPQIYFSNPTLSLEFWTHLHWP